MNLQFLTFLPVAVGFVMDLILGDPVWLYHPVRIMGHLITLAEKIIRGFLSGSKRREQIGGCILVIFILGISIGVPGLIVSAAYDFAKPLGFAAESLMCYQILAIRSLKTESDKVYRALKTEGIEQARRAVSMIVGRDTQNLTEEGIIKAAVETVAENTSDGVIAPLFYLMLGGPALGFGYKAVNTMDSMIGYKNARYQHFGTAAARLDDLANYIPARLSAWLMIGAAAIAGMDERNALRVYRRDRRNHKSPNAGQTESVMAGALHIQLAGNAWYFGELYEKPTIGDADRSVEAQDIRRAHTLLYTTALLALLVFGAARVSLAALL